MPALIVKARFFPPRTKTDLFWCLAQASLTKKKKKYQFGEAQAWRGYALLKLNPQQSREEMKGIGLSYS